jgi:hypothetical protein
MWFKCLQFNENAKVNERCVKFLLLYPIVRFFARQKGI